MPRLIDRLPVSAQATSVTLATGESASIRPLQPVVWISVCPPQVIELPHDAPRFPAVVDTGFNQTLLIEESQMQSWGGVSASTLQLFPGETVRYFGQTWHFRIADIWLHPNLPGDSTPDPSGVPFCLETHPGILVVSESQRRQRLPVLGMRALAWNRVSLQLTFDGPAMGFMSLEAED